MKEYKSHFKTIHVDSVGDIDARLNRFIERRSNYHKFEIIGHSISWAMGSFLCTIHYKYWDERDSDYNKVLEDSVE